MVYQQEKLMEQEQIKERVLEIINGEEGIYRLIWPIYTGSMTALICPFLNSEDAQGTITGLTKCTTGQTVEELLPIIAKSLTELIQEGRLKFEIRTEHLGLWIDIRPT